MKVRSCRHKQCSEVLAHWHIIRSANVLPNLEETLSHPSPSGVPWPSVERTMQLTIVSTLPRAVASERQCQLPKAPERRGETPLHKHYKVKRGLGAWNPDHNECDARTLVAHPAPR